MIHGNSIFSQKPPASGSGRIPRRGIGIAFFCALPLAALIPIALSQDNPVVGTQRVAGIVESAPKSDRGLYYQYGIRLNDNALILVDGELDRPHTIGSEVSLERQHHKKGADTFRLLLD